MEVAEKQTTVVSADLSQTTTSSSSETNKETRMEKTPTGGQIMVSVDGARKDDSSLTMTASNKKDEQSASIVAKNDQDMKQSTKLSQVEGDQKIERSQDEEQHATHLKEMEHSVKKVGNKTTTMTSMKQSTKRTYESTEVEEIEY